MNSTFDLVPLFALSILAILGWGYWRSRQQGRAGLLGWLQSVSLMLPWLVFLGLFATDGYLNATGFVLLLTISSGIYIAVGRLARKVSEEERLATAEFQRKLAERDRQTVEHRQNDENSHKSPLTEAGRGDRRTDSSGEDNQAGPEASEAKSSQEAELSGINPEDLQSIQSIFGIDTYYVTEVVPYGNGAIFKGNLRKEAAVVLPNLQQSLKQMVGDRYWLFIVRDREQKASVVVLPDETVNQPTPTSFKALASTLLVATVALVMELAANLFGFSLTAAPERWLETVPFAIGLMSIPFLHEVGQRWMAGRYGVRLSPAFLIPTLGLGTLGSLNRIESPVPNRQALFDIAIVGPAFGGIASLILFVLGLFLSGHSSDLFIPSSFFQYSILAGGLSRLVLGTQLQAEVVGIHPLAVVGWLGLLISALSLIPAGQLDGGRIVQAVYGRKIVGRTTFISIALLALAALGNQVALYWALLVLLIARDTERPPQDEITETDATRDALALVALFLMALMLLPLAPPLATRLGIGPL